MYILNTANGNLFNTVHKQKITLCIEDIRFHNLEPYNVVFVYRTFFSYIFTTERTGRAQRGVIAHLPEANSLPPPTSPYPLRCQEALQA